MNEQDIRATVEVRAAPTFGSLPPDIREHIWTMAVEPRCVGIVPRQVRSGQWTIRSTLPPPAVLQVNFEARRALLPQYPLLQARADLSGDVERAVLDVAPTIRFNFGLDTLHFVDTAPAARPFQDTIYDKPTTPTNPLDLLILKEGPNSFGPGMSRMVACNLRAMEWAYILEAKQTDHFETLGHRSELLNWIHVRYLRLDFNMFLSDLAQYWEMMRPFEKWMFHAAKRIQDPESSLRSCDLEMRGGGKNRNRTFRLAPRPQRHSIFSGTRPSASQRLQEDGAVVFSDVVSSPGWEVVLFEVVDVRTGDVAISKWEAFSAAQRQIPAPELIYPRLGPLAKDLSLFWALAIKKGTLAHGEMSAVHGLCLSDYGVELAPIK
ncbi:hypothetical protein NQ176_g4322 [Zarea fungicola]|uniref:Uncharacterized protein n=1 Tax=Zarea fungicola TaxID=93591 RepID=A0ACC1NE00_9HYPO|nr:hypothetical protein NQ176_g4322 [Lecanicillium fungicola]